MNLRTILSLVAALGTASPAFAQEAQPKPPKDSLKLEDIIKTPIMQKDVTVYYEIENHPDIHRNEFQTAVGLVQTFYEQYQVNIRFIPVQHLYDAPIDRKTKFGLRYSSTESFAYEYNSFILGIDINQLDKQVQELCYTAQTESAIDTCLDFKATKKELVGYSTEMFRTENVDGLAMPTYGRASVHLTKGKFSTEITWLEKLPKLERWSQYASDVPSYFFAGVIAHELGHLWGLFHPVCENDGIDRFRHGTANLMLDVNTGFFSEVINQLENSFSLSSLGKFITPAQVAVMHNYLSGGSVFQDLQARDLHGYTEHLAKANKWQDCK
ncbi:MAG: hypothetical protein Q7R76_01375 [Candidatus Woesearchaeota archaeon]|nr:hypothetical protein [Candidatus Woesearchaeota archaeon]